MDKILIVSGTEKSFSPLMNVLKGFGGGQFVCIQSSAEASRRIVAEDFDIIVVNTPLTDNFGYDFAVNASNNTAASIIFLCKNDIAEDFSIKLLDYGVYVVGKPLDRNILMLTYRTAVVTHQRISAFQKENAKLTARLSELKYINKAKCMLIEWEKKSENDAHKYIEQTAMNTRKSKLEIAKEIIEKYSD